MFTVRDKVLVKINEQDIEGYILLVDNVKKIVCVVLSGMNRHPMFFKFDDIRKLEDDGSQNETNNPS